MRSIHYRFIQPDVFTDQPFTGNASAVFPEGEGLTGEQMQQIAREMNLSETVFVLPSDKEGVLRKLRIFTPTKELPFAGHPIAGTWNCLAREGVVPVPEGGSGVVQIKHEVGIGVLPVEIAFKDGAPSRVVMTRESSRLKLRSRRAGSGGHRARVGVGARGFGRNAAHSSVLNRQSYVDGADPFAGRPRSLSPEH